MTESRCDRCKFMIKKTRVGAEAEEIIEVIAGTEVRKIKKVVQKLDENGLPMYEIKEVTVKKGCGCKGKKRTESVIKKRVPITEEKWVTEEIHTKESRVISGNVVKEALVVCKLYGKVKKSYCEKCSTFKEIKSGRRG